MKGKDKREDWDNGMTVAPMGETKRGFTHRADDGKNTRKQVGGEEYTKKEQKAMIGGMFLAMLPRLLAVLAGFGLAILLIVLWLGGAA